MVIDIFEHIKNIQAGINQMRSRGLHAKAMICGESYWRAFEEELKYRKMLFTTVPNRKVLYHTLMGMEVLTSEFISDSNCFIEASIESAKDTLAWIHEEQRKGKTWESVSEEIFKKFPSVGK